MTRAMIIRRHTTWNGNGFGSTTIHEAIDNETGELLGEWSRYGLSTNFAGIHRGAAVARYVDWKARLVELREAAAASCDDVETLRRERDMWRENAETAHDQLRALGEI